MAQTLAEMIEEYGDIGAKNPWMNVHAYAALKQAQALQGIEAVLRGMERVEHVQVGEIGKTTVTTGKRK